MIVTKPNFLEEKRASEFDYPIFSDGIDSEEEGEPVEKE